MSTEIPIWVNGKIRWLSGIDKNTTSKDVVEVLLEEEGVEKSEVKNFAIIERWKKVERPLDDNSKILRIWSHWGCDKKDVRFSLRCVDHEVDSGRGSPTNNGHIPSLKKKRNRARGNGKPPWTHPETLHPKRLAELGRLNKKDQEDYFKIKQNNNLNDDDRLNDTYVYDNDFYKFEDLYSQTCDIKNAKSRKKTGHKNSYHCTNTGKLHSTLLSKPENSKRTSKCCSKRISRQKVRNSESIEKLIKLILVQGATIRNQLQKLKEREEQIESLEHERHRERIEKNGRNYLLETYLGSLKDAEFPDDVEENERQLYAANEENIETETGKIFGKDQLRGHRAEEKNNQFSTNQSYSKLRQKNKRSKSESRTQECKLEGNLKRALSDNAIAEIGGAVISDNSEGYFAQLNLMHNTKELTEVLELRRIQNQIEMWEKVFKINKKLEKEEETLVRLHINIKKCQAENFRFVKSAENLESCDDVHPLKIRGEDFCDEGCAELQKSLETLRSDLEQNSKEIYHNFTKLIEEDKIVEQKRDCLTKLMSDLEITDHEHECLREMLREKEKGDVDLQPPKLFVEKKDGLTKGKDCEGSDAHPADENTFRNVSSATVGISSEEKNDQIFPKVLDLPKIIHNYRNQRTESNVKQDSLRVMKPKIVENQFHNQVNSISEVEKSTKEETLTGTGALKSILKNKKNFYKKNLDKCLNDSQQSLKSPLGYSSNNDILNQRNNLFVKDNCVPVQYILSTEIPNQIPPSYSYRVPFQTNNLSKEPLKNIYNHSSKLSENPKTAYPIRNCPPSGISKTPNLFPHSTMVTTKALVHNDTDSSTSSDTSGLSSMHSSSPTVEEPYVEQVFVLDTLV